MVKGVKMIEINNTMWEVKQNTLYHIEYVNNRKNTICEVSDLSGLEVWEFIKLVDEIKFHYPDYDIKNLYDFSGVELLVKNKNRPDQKLFTSYAVLSEDRGGDTEVTLHSNYEDAKKIFNNIVSDLKVSFDDLNDNDGEYYLNLHNDHLSYDLGESWGNIKIYKKTFKIKGVK